MSSGSSMVFPHVAGIMATVMGFEGWKALQPGYLVYDRLNETTKNFVNRDDVMKERGTSIRLLQSSMDQSRLRPSSGFHKCEWRRESRDPG